MKHFKSNYLTVLLVGCLAFPAAQSVGAATDYGSTTLDRTEALNLLNWLSLQQGTNDDPWIQTAIDDIQNLVDCGPGVCPDSYTLLLSPAGKTLAMTGAASTGTAGGGDDEPEDPPVSPN